MKFFKTEEFDSPDMPGSGEMMHTYFLEKLIKARSIAKIPFVINSGYRTPLHNTRVGGSPNSSHMKGLAADIRVTSDSERAKILGALIKAGFTRIGIARNFIHVDSDFDKSQNVFWLY